MTQLSTDIKTQMFCSTCVPLHLRLGSPGSFQGCLLIRDLIPLSAERRAGGTAVLSAAAGGEEAEPLKRFRVGFGLLILIAFPGTHAFSSDLLRNLRNPSVL